MTDMLGGEKAAMSRKQWRKVSLVIGLAVGVLADGYLRLISGDEGNFLIHTMVFLGGTLIAAGVVYELFYSREQAIRENCDKSTP